MISKFLLSALAFKFDNMPIYTFICFSLFLLLYAWADDKDQKKSQKVLAELENS